MTHWKWLNATCVKRADGVYVKQRPGKGGLMWRCYIKGEPVAIGRYGPILAMRQVDETHPLRGETK